MSDLAYKISVMQAAQTDKPIQCKSIGPYGNMPNWEDGKDWAWDWANYDYRIAPEPRKPRDFWIACYSAHGLDTFVGHAFSEKNPPQLSSGSTYYSVIHVREVIEE